MSLNIKNPEVHALAAELARLSGVSVTRAVLDAVRHEVEREKNQRRDDHLAEQLIEIGMRCAKHVDTAASSADHGSLLYGDEGLPL